jgi:RND family efflux transporter MFP subunit
LGRRLFVVVLSTTAMVTGIWLARRAAHSQEVGSDTVAGPAPPVPSVEVIRPQRGGIERTIQQPASINSFETVDLYAMVSGYLKWQKVDIGSRIQKGEILAEIDVPRDAKVAEEAASLVGEVKAQILQAEARIKMAGAQQDAAAAAVKVAESDMARLTAHREFAEKQFTRVRALVAEKAVDVRLVEEHQRDREAAVAAERTGLSEIQSAKAKLLAASAAVDQARADAAETRASLGVAEARLDKARVNLDYAKIVAPFDGVVTHRAFHPGALIRAATEGGNQPVLTVKRTDLMRVVVLVPDRDVVLTSVGDPAVVSVDALADKKFPGTLARCSRSEDAERLMRVEIDLPNPDGLLCDGMYGKATITPRRDTTSLTVPTGCVIEHVGRDHGVVFLVRAGAARRTEVKLGGDNGSQVEILSGISADDAIVSPSGIPLEDGMSVSATTAR